MLIRLEQHRVQKPWGRTDLSAQFGGEQAGRLGEIWFQRQSGADDALLVKYLFTSERLSVQVHPDDVAAHALGLRRGKDEAWLVLGAEPNAEIGIGLIEPLDSNELRDAAADGSIVEALHWRQVAPGDVYYSPAGTIHAIGAGLTLLEIQQNCDITYRLYDYGRDRELHLDEGLRALNADVAVEKSQLQFVRQGRQIIAAGRKFTVERWRSGNGDRISASREYPMWLIPLNGPVEVAGKSLNPADVWIAEGPINPQIGEGGDLVVAYEGAPRTAAQEPSA